MTSSSVAISGGLSFMSRTWTVTGTWLRRLGLSIRERTNDRTTGNHETCNNNLLNQNCGVFNKVWLRPYWTIWKTFIQVINQWRKKGQRLNTKNVCNHKSRRLPVTTKNAAVKQFSIVLHFLILRILPSLCVHACNALCPHLHTRITHLTFKTSLLSGYVDHP